MGCASTTRPNMGILKQNIAQAIIINLTLSMYIFNSVSFKKRSMDFYSSLQKYQNP